MFKDMSESNVSEDDFKDRVKRRRIVKKADMGPYSGE